MLAAAVLSRSAYCSPVAYSRSLSGALDSHPLRGWLSISAERQGDAPFFARRPGVQSAAGMVATAARPRPEFTV